MTAAQNAVAAPQNKQALVTENLKLVHACANRFRGRGVEYEDLFQAGCMGLVKAAKGFDPARGFRFSTYAVPAILGEMRRLFRDGGSVKISRSAKEKAAALLKLRERLTEELGAEPGIIRLAQEAGLEPAEAAGLLSACLPTFSLTADDDASETAVPVPGPEETLTQKLDLKNAMDRLDARDRQMLTLRFFKGMTQSAVAEQLGMTQVQVSRREKAALAKLRGWME